MKQIDKKVTINWKLNTSTFYKKNVEALGETDRLLGSTMGATKYMLARVTELKSYMPDVLGIDPNSAATDFTKAIDSYLNCLAVVIPSGGKTLNVGFYYDVDDDKTKAAIMKLMEAEKLKTEADVVAFVENESNVSLDDKWKYGKPIEPADYLLYRYCREHSQVANKLADVDKSAHIRFYLHTEEELLANKRNSMNLMKLAMEKYVLAAKDVDTIENILYVKQVSMSGLDAADKERMLFDLANDKPQEFLDIVQDTNLKAKATIERYILNNLWRRLENSAIIVDYNDVHKQIGHSIDEAIVFMNDAKNKAYLTELEIKLKGLLKASK